MRVLVVGGGGREHALVWKLAQSPRVKKIFCAPGNGGITGLARCVDIKANDIEALAAFARRERIDLTVVGPEEALSLGIVDLFEKKGLRIFGPTRRAAVLEASKVFTKNFLKKYGIPTADYRVCKSFATATAALEKMGAPVVIKADGLAAGKGVIVCQSMAEAREAIDRIMRRKEFGVAGRQLVLEEFMDGEEASFLAFTDGEHVLPLPASQDHKRVHDFDQGPNTGGMGAYSPAPVVTSAVHEQVMREIMLPTVRAMAAEKRKYKGLLYAGLMIKGGRARVVEFNCRFGDPEAQPLCMRLSSDLVEAMEATIDGRLDKISLQVDPRPAVCVVMAAAGYPGAYEKGKVIHGLAKAAAVKDAVVFHGGTVRTGKTIATAGGRVLGVTAMGDTLAKAIATAYEACGRISWDGAFYRRDIGKKALGRVGENRGQGQELCVRSEDPPPYDCGNRVGIVMGSDSDLPVMKAAADFLKKMAISSEMTIASAHRTPERATEYAAAAAGRGVRVIIAGAGMAAHLAGVIAAHTTLPVIGVPLDSSPLHGMDALLSTAQMPPGVPVACMGIGKSGAVNAAVLATRILALQDTALAARLDVFRREMQEQVEEKAAVLAKSLSQS